MMMDKTQTDSCPVAEPEVELRSASSRSEQSTLVKGTRPLAEIGHYFSIQPLQPPHTYLINLMDKMHMLNHLFLPQNGQLFV